MSKDGMGGELEALVKQIADVNQLVMAEYDFKYGDGSGQSAYDIAKLHKLRNKALKHYAQSLKQLFLDTVGQDESDDMELFPTLPNGEYMRGFLDGSNSVRAELRSKLEAL